MKQQLQRTDEGYLVILGEFQMEIYAEINQVWVLKIKDFAFKFDSTKQAMDFIHSFK